MRIGSRRPTRDVLVPGPVIMPGLSPSTRPTSWDTVAVFGNAGSIQLTPASLSHARSEEHTSELQSRLHLVCRLLLEKKKKQTIRQQPTTWIADKTRDQ